MNDAFLSSLIDSTGSTFVFGKTESFHQSVFLDTGKSHSQASHTDTFRYVKLYQGNELTPLHTKAIPRNNITPDWFLPIILIILVVFTWIRIFYNKFFTQMIQAFLNNNLANQIVRDENIFVQRASVYLSLVFNLVGALFLYLVSTHYNWSLGGIGNGFSRFIFFIIIISSVYALKFLVLKVCGWLFEQEREMATYIFNIFLVNNILGMALLPFVCIIAFNETISSSRLIVIPLILLGAAFLWRILRGIQIGLSITSVSLSYLFLYLCTLEIAPLMVLIRIIVQ